MAKRTFNGRIEWLEATLIEEAPADDVGIDSPHLIELYEAASQLNYAQFMLANFIAGPVRGWLTHRKPDEAAEQYALHEVARCALCCGQKWLRAKAAELELLGLEESKPDCIEMAEALRRRAQQLDDAGIPDFSASRSCHIPLAAGRTWQDKLAWAIALGDRLADELVKVRWFDNQENCFYGRLPQAGDYYESPLSTVPPLPGWLTEGLWPNPHPCVPYRYSEGHRLECP